jgi:predicted NBD/HSP70 family sugar kinase
MGKESLVVDLGGTNLRIGRAKAGSEILARTETPRVRGKILQEISQFVEKTAMLYEIDVDCLIVGCPGLISHEGGIEAALYWQAAGLDLNGFLRKKFPKTKVVNDANLQALGATDVIQNGVFLSFGTGVGGAVVIDGCVVTGQNGFAGEFGHLKTQSSSNECLCGRKGCLDTVASGYWLERILGSEWWSNMGESEVTEAMTIAAHATIECVADVVRVLDLNTIYLTGHIVHQKAFRRGIDSSLQRLNDGIRLEYTDDTWSLAVRGAEKLINQFK